MCIRLNKTDTGIRRNPFLRFTCSFHFTPFRFIPLPFHFTRIRSIPFHLFRYEISFLFMTPERRALRRSAHVRNQKPFSRNFWAAEWSFDLTDVTNQTPWQDELRGLPWLFWFEDGQSGADRPEEILSNQFLPFHTSTWEIRLFLITPYRCVLRRSAYVRCFEDGQSEADRPQEKL